MDTAEDTLASEALDRLDRIQVRKPWGRDLKGHVPAMQAAQKQLSAEAHARIKARKDGREPDELEVAAQKAQDRLSTEARGRRNPGAAAAQARLSTEAKQRITGHG